MKGTQAKSKMVSFRLPLSEYAEKLELCRTRGYRNMSHFGLCAMRSFAPPLLGDPLSNSDELRLRISEANELRRRIDELANEIKQLSESVRGDRASSVRGDRASRRTSSGAAASSGQRQ
jgi:hypothetical protein